MTRPRLFLICIFAVTLCCRSSHAAIVVFGQETSLGNYSFTFAQELGSDPIQTRGFIPLNFAFDNNFIVVPGSPGGSITDGTTTLSAALTAWSDASNVASSIDPNLIFSPTSFITASSTPGIDFDATPVTWRITSNEFFNGAPLTGVVRSASSIPEPSAVAFLLATACATTLGYRRRR